MSTFHVDLYFYGLRRACQDALGGRYEGTGVLSRMMLVVGGGVAVDVDQHAHRGKSGRVHEGDRGRPRRYRNEAGPRAGEEERGRTRAVAGRGRYITGPVGSIGSNGLAERAIQCFEQQARIMKDALEKRWRDAVFLNRYEFGTDGRKALERLQGRAEQISASSSASESLKKRKTYSGVAQHAQHWNACGVHDARGERECNL